MMTPGKRASWSGKELSSTPKLAPRGIRRRIEDKDFL
jgi:hypothetical protein